MIKMTSYSQNVTQTKQANNGDKGHMLLYATVRKVSFIDFIFSFGDFEGFGWKVKKPMLNRVKVEIVNNIIFISTSKFRLPIQFRPTIKLYIRKMLWSDIFPTSK